MYVTDTLWGIAHGKGFETRYKDFFHRQPEDTRTAEEIIDHIRTKLEGGEPQ